MVNIRKIKPFEEPDKTDKSMIICGYPFMLGVCQFGLSAAAVKVEKNVTLFHLFK